MEKDKLENDLLNAFKKQYPNINSGDMQTFILGMAAMKESQQVKIDSLLNALKNMCEMWEQTAAAFPAIINEERYIVAKEKITEANG